MWIFVTVCGAAVGLTVVTTLASTGIALRGRPADAVALAEWVALWAVNVPLCPALFHGR